MNAGADRLAQLVRWQATINPDLFIRDDGAALLYRGQRDPADDLVIVGDLADQL